MKKYASTLISYTACTPVPCMKTIKTINADLLVNGDITVSEYGTVVFYNSLSDDADAQIRFYENATAKRLNNPVSGFCSGTGDYLTVPWADGGAKCELTQNVGPAGKQYIFTVSSPGYRTLDPVIIIEDVPRIFNSLFIGILIALILGLFVGRFMFGKKASSA